MRSPASNGGRYRSTISEAKFWARVEKSDEPEGCWIWTGPKLPTGYGTWGGGRNRGYAHRTAFELARGPIPSGQWVLHRCDNPSCVRPDHLFLGTPKDNSQDMVEKGRLWFKARPEGLKKLQGENHSCAKLTWAQVREIRRLWCETGLALEEIASPYPVGSEHIGRIVRNRSWKDPSYDPREAFQRQERINTKAAPIRGRSQSSLSPYLSELNRQLAESLEERFWAKVDKSAGAEGCWPWTASRKDNGFGQACVGHQKVRMAHKVAYEFANHMKLGERMAVRHSCGNPACCNPAHLYLHEDWGRGRKREITRGKGKW